MKTLKSDQRKEQVCQSKRQKYVLSTIVFQIFKFKIAMAAFENFVRKVFDATLNFRYQRVRNPKIKATFLMSILKVDYKIGYIFSELLLIGIPKIEVCLKYFLDKNS